MEHTVFDYFWLRLSVICPLTNIKQNTLIKGVMQKRNISKIIKMGGLVACLMMAVGIGVFFINSNRTGGTKNDENEEGYSVAIYPDVAPMVYANDTLDPTYNAD